MATLKFTKFNENEWERMLYDRLLDVPPKETQKEKDMKVLRNMNIEHIEEFLRNKKLEKITNKIKSKK